ncbi:GD18798 [Drosophila simulans]|uniref:GD18798 n=1 Tax=Drosophila simulans TaxID=7240 RepID=B4QT20_DROSI|nr:GD18798 [Drosophila simulans]
MLDKPAPVGASWYTNLSDFQVQAVEALAFSIRDDHAEGTVYRTQFCLSRLESRPW